MNTETKNKIISNIEKFYEILKYDEKNQKVYDKIILILKNVHEKFISKDILVEIIKEVPYLFEYIDKDLLSYKDLLSILKKAPNLMINLKIPNNIDKNKLYLNIVKKHGYTISYIKEEEFITYELWLEAIKSGYINKDIPKYFIDYNMCLEISKIKNGNSYIPIEIIDKQILINIIKYDDVNIIRNNKIKNLIDKEVIDILLDTLLNDIYNFYRNSTIIDYIPKEFIDKENAIKLIKIHEYNICNIPKEILDKDIILEITKNKFNAHEFIPSEYLEDYEICLNILLNNRNGFKSIPIHMWDKNMIIEYIKEHKDGIYYMISELNIYDIIDKEIALLIMNYKSKYTMSYIPKHLIDKEIVIKCIKELDQNNFKFIPENFFLDEEILLLITKNNPY